MKNSIHFPRFILRIALYGTQSLAKHDMQKLTCFGVNIIALAIVLINLTIGIWACILTGKEQLVAGVCIETLLAPIPVILNYYKRRFTATICLFLIVNGAVLYFSCILGRMVEIQLMIIFFVGLSLFLFLNIKHQIIGIAIAACNIVLVERNFQYAFLKPIGVDESKTSVLRWAVYVVIGFLVILLFWLYKKGALLLLDKLQRYTIKVERNLQLEVKANREKDKFIGNAYHETKTSFFTISAMINILDQTNTRDEVKTIAGNIRAAFQVSTAFVENILRYVKNQVGVHQIDNELVDVRKLLIQVIDIYKFVGAEREVSLSYAISHDFPDLILLDKGKFKQIISNLISNAIKHSPHESTVHVQIEKLAINTWRLSVADKGVGIRQELLDKIFEPFFTTNPKGTGLGLYIVKDLTTALQGTVRVNSTNKGTNFIIDMPFN